MSARHKRIDPLRCLAVSTRRDWHRRETMSARQSYQQQQTRQLIVVIVAWRAKMTNNNRFILQLSSVNKYNTFQRGTFRHIHIRHFYLGSYNIWMTIERYSMQNAGKYHCNNRNSATAFTTQLSSNASVLRNSLIPLDPAEGKIKFSPVWLH